VDAEEALILLEATASHNGLFSEFRASNLLQVVSGARRSQELVSLFGREDYELPVAKACLQVAFYPESTLEALKVLQERPELTPRAAAEEVVAKKEALTRGLFEAQGLAHKALREAEEAQAVLESHRGKSGNDEALRQTSECKQHVQASVWLLAE